MKKIKNKINISRECLIEIGLVLISSIIAMWMIYVGNKIEQIQKRLEQYEINNKLYNEDLMQVEEYLKK